MKALLRPRCAVAATAILGLVLHEWDVRHAAGSHPAEAKISGASGASQTVTVRGKSPQGRQTLEA